MEKIMINNINDFTVEMLKDLPNDKKIKLAYAFCYSGYYDNFKYDISKCTRSAEILYKQVKATGTIRQKGEAEEQLNGPCKSIWRNFFGFKEYFG